jgi:hypothetical protein
MAKDLPYHTTSQEYPPEHRSVHHDHSDCPDGKRIKDWHRQSGTGGKPLCKQCAKMARIKDDMLADLRCANANRAAS